jgi:hypothetical protein
MGLAKHGRLPFGIVLVVGLLALTAAPNGCKNKKNDVSSEAFMAPQAIGVSSSSSAVSTLLSKLQILRKAKADPTTGVEPLDSDLATIPAKLYPIGKIDDENLVVFEAESRTLLTINILKGTLVRSMTQKDFLNLFRNQAQRPNLGALIKLKSGWILGYEKTTRSLFGVRKDPTSTTEEPKIQVQLVLDQNDMENQIFSSEWTNARSQITIRSLVAFASSVAQIKDEAGTVIDTVDRDDILMISENPEVDAIHHLQVNSSQTDGTLEAHFIVPEGKPFLDLDDVRRKTSNTKVDLVDFPPVKIPGLDQVLLFDKTQETSAFLILNFASNEDETYRTWVDVTVRRNEILTAIEEANKGGQPFTGEFSFGSSFLHAYADPADKPAGTETTPIVFAFDDETNNLIAYDFSVPTGTAGKVKVFTSSTMLTERTDLNFDPTHDGGTFDPVLAFSGDSVVDNKVAFDGGPSELLSFNYLTGQVVVILHKRDITDITDAGLVNVTYMETMDPPGKGGKGKDLRIIDFVSGFILAVHLDYVAVPVKYPR